jgi:hypothetical protein
MATKKQTETKWTTKSKKKRPGVHSKKSNSKLKKSKNYKKEYAGQGR